MAVDIQDFTQAVNVIGGSVSISGVATVVVSGTANVSITGANTVVLGGGTASIGSISAIGSTVTVAGTVNIGNTPAVTISGTPTVNINSGAVSIVGTPNINILSQSVQVSTNQPQKLLSSGAIGIGATVVITPTVDIGTHALILGWAGTSTLTTASFIKGNNVGNYWIPNDPVTSPSLIAMPWVAAIDTAVNGSLTTSGGPSSYWLAEVLDTEAPILTGTEQAFSKGAKRPTTGTKAVIFNAALAAAATLVLVANPPSGQTIYVYHWNYVVATLANASVRLEDSSQIASLAYAYTNVAHAISHELDGMAVLTGAGVNMRNDSAAAAGALLGELVYTQPF
jgi:hypothetical protein